MEVGSEPEIKIEHYESQEKDPLCDNTFNDNPITSVYEYIFSYFEIMILLSSYF